MFTWRRVGVEVERLGRPQMLGAQRPVLVRA